jgi:hypothetical protein
MADDLLRHPSDLDQRVEIDAGLDAHLLAQQHQLFSADVAGRALVRGEGTAAEAADRGIEAAHAHAQARMGVRHRKPAGVVQMQPDPLIRPAAAHLADHPRDPLRRRPSHRVRQRNIGDRSTALLGDVKAVFKRAQDLRRCDVALEIAAERGHHADPVDRHVLLEMQPGRLSHRLQILGVTAVEILLRERLGGGQ